jgi:4-hydroxy-tetrahydrodipicolinate synthase
MAQSPGSAASALSGLIPIVVTPYRDDGTIDVARLEAEVDALLGRGVTMIGIGLASEVLHLSEEERSLLSRTLVGRTRGRAGVIAGVGADTVEMAVQRARAALEAGVTHLLVTPPTPDPGEAAIFDYYAALDAAVPAPIIIQDATPLTGVKMSADLIARMGREIEHVVAAKLEAPPTPPKFGEVRAKAGGSLQLLGGMAARSLLDEVRQGAAGTMPGPGTTLLFLDRVWERLAKKAWKEAAEIFYGHSAILFWSAGAPGRFLYLEKEILRRLELFERTSVRVPFPLPSPDELGDVDVILAQVGLAGGPASIPQRIHA